MRIVGVITEPAVITIPGYREVIVYYIDGRYYDQNGWGYPRADEIVVFERDGRFYRETKETETAETTDLFAGLIYIGSLQRGCLTESPTAGIRCFWQRCVW